MTSILILLLLHGGGISAHYLAEFDSQKTCELAKPKVAQVARNSPLVAQADAAALICVPKREV